MPSPLPRWLHVEQVGDVTVARFPHRCDLMGEAVELIGDQLEALVDEEGRCRLLLNLDGVDILESKMLGRLLTLNKKVLAAGGRLKLCCVPPHLAEVFERAKLDNLMGIYPSEEEALRTY
ncbi:MAG TPA: STAS domain-containing protein [Gemmataceae bacterium]|nr:STAS domain-containing protein [Gemmataceae bacterium]